GVAYVITTRYQLLQSTRRSTPSPAARPHIFRLRSDDAIALALLEAMRDPAGDAAHCERRREERHFESNSVEYKCSVELDVRLQLAARFVFFEQAQRGR